MKSSRGSQAASFAINITPKSLLDPKVVSAIVALPGAVSATVELSVSSIANMSVSSLAKLPPSHLAGLVVSFAARLADSVPVRLAVSSVATLSRELERVQSPLINLTGNIDDLLKAVDALRSKVAFDVKNG